MIALECVLFSKTKVTLRKLMCGWARLCVKRIDSRSPSFLSVNISPFSARWDETSMGRAAGGAADPSSSSVMSLKCSQLLRLPLVKLTLMQLSAFKRWKGTSKLSCLQYAKQGEKKSKSFTGFCLNDSRWVERCFVTKWKFIFKVVQGLKSQ